MSGLSITVREIVERQHVEGKTYKVITVPKSYVDIDLTPSDLDLFCFFFSSGVYLACGVLAGLELMKLLTWAQTKLALWAVDKVDNWGKK